METIALAKPVVDDEVLDFRPALNEDIKKIREILLQNPSRSCDYSIGGIFMWIRYYNYKICIYNRTLFIMGMEDNIPFFYRPIGELTKEESYGMIYKFCKINGIFPRIISEVTIPVEIPEEDINQIEYKREWMEYLYPVEKFIGFPGKKMEKKRNHLNAFYKNFPDYKIIPISERYFQQLKEFTESFDIHHGGDETFDYESVEVLKVLNHFSEYPFFGFMIVNDNKILGYSFGEIIGDTLFAHVEKGDGEIRGIYQALSSILCKIAKNKNPNIKYVNREEDMGYEALKKSKMSYHPSHYILKHWE